MRVAICDDVESDRNELKKALYRFEKERNIELDIREYPNPEPLYMDCKERNDLQIIFFDIYMGDELGTDAAKKIREMGYKGSIVFCTTSQEHALDGFRVQADGYLVKPFTYDDLKIALNRLDNLINNEAKKISFVSERIEYNIQADDVYYIETYNKGCIVYTKNGELFTWTKLREFTEKYPFDCLYQLGRFFVVNLNNISMIKDDRIVMKNNAKIDMPKREAMRIKQDINDYIWNSMRK